MKITNRRILMAIGIAVFALFALPILQVDAAVTNVASFQGSSLEDGATELTSATPKSIRWNAKTSIDPTTFEHSLTDSAKVIVKKDGDYLVAATAPFISISPAGGLPTDNRPSQVIEVYVNGEPAPGTVGQTSYIRNQPRNANMHQEASDHVHALLKGLSANDVIELRVHKHSQPGIPVAMPSASFYLEHVEDSREVFAGLSSGPTDGTNLNPDFLNAGDPQAELAWESTRKDGGFTHSDGSSDIRLTAGTYLVFVNVPMTSAAQRASAGMEILLDNVPVPGGLARQGYIRNSGQHTLASVHWAGLVQVSGTQTLTFATSQLALAGEVTVQDGKQGSVFIERIDSSSGVVFKSAMLVDADDPVNWNPAEKASIVWENELIAGGSTYGSGAGDTQIQVRQAGSYLLVYNDALQSTGARPSAKITVEVNGSPVPGAEVTTHYNRNNDGHNETSGTMVILLEDLAANDAVTVSTQREANTQDMIQDDFANEVATLALIQKETLSLPADDQSAPRVVSFSGDIFGFNIGLQDLGLDVNQSTIQASWNGQSVQATASESGGATTVSYPYPTIPESNSIQEVTVTFQDNGSPAGTHSAEFSYAIETQFIGIPSGFAAVGVDTSKPGFVANVTQVSTGQSEVANVHGNTIAGAEDQLAGVFVDAFGQSYYNEADPNAGFGGAWTVPSEDVSGVINFEDAGGAAGNFDSDDLIPGIPGTFDSVDGIAAEFITFLELSQGFHTLGVNSEDGFQVTSGVSPKDQLAKNLGFFSGTRGAGDTLFNIVVQEDGIYPFRVLWWAGDGGASLEFFSVHEGENILINDTSNPNAIKAYREAQARPYVSSFGPGSGKVSQTVDFEITDADLEVVSGSISLSVDGVDQTANAQISKSGGVTTVTFDNGDYFSGGNHTATLTYDESSTPVVTRVLPHTFHVPNGITEVLLDEPFAYWTLGEQSGDVVDSELGTGHTSILFGEPTLGAERVAVGASTTSILFDASKDQWIDIPDHANINDSPSNPGWKYKTVELWFKARNLPTSAPVLPGVRIPERQIIYAQGGTTRGITVYLSGTQESNPTEAELWVNAINVAQEAWGGTLPAENQGSALPLGDPVAVSTTIQANTPYHLVWVMEGDDEFPDSFEGKVTGYLNGEKFGETSGVHLLYDHTDDNSLGARNEQVAFHDYIVQLDASPELYAENELLHYDGWIDEVALYNTALPEARVKAHYQAGITEVPLGTGGGGGGGGDTGATLVSSADGSLSTPSVVNFGDLSDSVSYEFVFNAVKAGASTAIAGDNAFAIKLDQWNEQGVFGTTAFGVADNLFTPVGGQSVDSVFGRSVHVVIVSDTSGSESRLYVDGVHSGSWDGTFVLTGDVKVMGARLTQDTDHMGDGSVMDHWATYQGALTDAQIAEMAAAWAAPAGGINTDGLTAYWSFDGDLSASVGSLDGTAQGAVGFVDGQAGFGQAISLDGSGYVEIMDSATALDFAGGSLSISGWFTVGSFDKSWQALIAKGEQSAYRVARRGGGDSIAYAGGVGEGADDAPAVNDGAWHHFVAVSDASAAEFGTALYIDGVRYGVQATAPGIEAETTNLFIGENPEALNRQWIGSIDDIGLWNRVLSADEVSALYAGGTGVALSTAVGGGGPAISGVTLSGTDLTFSWSGGGTLETATSIEGPWTEVAGAASPHTAPTTGAGAFFRVRQ